MTSPIEAAARALAKKQSGADDYDALDEGLQEALKDEVRAVLGAIPRPSWKMLQAADNIEMAPWDSGWEAMINAALEEG